jgi:hypothetical protein
MRTQRHKKSSTAIGAELLVIKKQKPYNGKITRQPAGPKQRSRATMASRKKWLFFIQIIFNHIEIRTADQFFSFL